jgi:hypothetical protein
MKEGNMLFTSPAPKLHLTFQDLSERYGLGPHEVGLAWKEVERQHGQKQDVFMKTDAGFNAWLQ